MSRSWPTGPRPSAPRSPIGTFGAMYLLGYSIDNLSLMALTIAVGFVVDDAIVMIENIVRHIEEGDTPYEAAVKGSRQIGFTIISITVSVAVVISAFVSLTLTPTMCARFLSADQGRHGKFYMTLENFFDWLI